MRPFAPLAAVVALLLVAGACSSTSIGPGFCDPTTIELDASIDVIPIGTMVIGGVCADLCPADASTACLLATASSIQCSAGCP
jgi:hypothetical protein